jgi:hypothetical protein
MRVTVDPIPGSLKLFVSPTIRQILEIVGGEIESRIGSQISSKVVNVLPEFPVAEE